MMLKIFSSQEDKLQNCESFKVTWEEENIQASSNFRW